MKEKNPGETKESVKKNILFHSRPATDGSSSPSTPYQGPGSHSPSSRISLEPSSSLPLPTQLLLALQAGRVEGTLRTGAGHEDPEQLGHFTDTAVAFPLPAYGPNNENGNQAMELVQLEGPTPQPPPILQVTPGG